MPDGRISGMALILEAVKSRSPSVARPSSPPKHCNGLLCTCTFREADGVRAQKAVRCDAKERLVRGLHDDEALARGWSSWALGGHSGAGSPRFSYRCPAIQTRPHFRPYTLGRTTSRAAPARARVWTRRRCTSEERCTTHSPSRITSRVCCPVDRALGVGHAYSYADVLEPLLVVRPPLGDIEVTAPPETVRSCV